MPTGVRTLTRQELFDLVWSAPGESVAADLGISGVALGKCCRRANVPKPGRGYWAKVTAGHRVGRPRLGAAPKGWVDPMRINITGPEERGHWRLPEEPAVEVVSPLTRPHVLVVASQEAMLKREHVRRRRAVLAVDVSEAQRKRAWVLMDALIKALEARGMPVEVTKPEERSEGEGRGKYTRHIPSRTLVAVQGQSVDFELVELQDRHVGPIPERPKTVSAESWHFYAESHPAVTYTPNGRLRLQITNKDYGLQSRRRLTDRTGGRKLEELLHKFVAIVRDIGQQLHERYEAEHRAQRERQERERRAEQERRRREREAHHVYDLEARMREWHKAAEVRGFMAEAEARLTREGPLSQAATSWLEWGRKHAASLETRALSRLSELRPAPWDYVSKYSDPEDEEGPLGGGSWA